MAERPSNYSGNSSEKYRANGSRNGLKEANHSHPQSTATTMSTPGDETKDDKKVSWETMLPSNRGNTIGNKFTAFSVWKTTNFISLVIVSKMLELGEKLPPDLEEHLHCVMRAPQPKKLNWGWCRIFLKVSLMKKRCGKKCNKSALFRSRWEKKGD